jgi:drug/metabolite transporter (DMT)-like permease
MGDSFNPYLGPAAGVATSVLWSFTAISFSAASRRIGASTVNTTRIGLAVLWLGISHRLFAGVWIPPACGGQVWLLALSGLVGLTVGDLALFSAFVDVGPRLAMLVMTTAPLLAALFGWVFLGETLGGLSWLGMAVTLVGVGWVVLERPETPAAGQHRARGLLLAFIGAVCQAAGSLLSKGGMGHGWLPEEQFVSPQAAALMRMFFAGVFSVPVIVWLAYRPRLRSATSQTADSAERRRRVGYLLTFAGSIVGPYLGMWMSLEAFHRTPLGVGQTLCSLSPVIILPLVVFFEKERVTTRAALGAAAAVLGTVLLFLPGASE